MKRKMKQNTTIMNSMRSAKNSMEVEGFQLSKKHDKLVKRTLEGKITDEQFIKAIRGKIQ